MAVPVVTTPALNAGRPEGHARVSGAGGWSAFGRFVFEKPYFGWIDMEGHTYDVSHDGMRFLVVKPDSREASAPAELRVILNWSEGLHGMVPEP